MNTFCTTPSLLLHEEFHMDQSAFYTLGRSIVYGLVPYVDVADVKGPLLYLVFALGYSISPESFFGISLLFSVSTWVVLMFAYKTGRAVGLTKGQALMATLASLIFLFEPVGQDFGGKTEEFMKPAIAALIYGLVCFGCSMSQGEGERARAVRKLGWIIGSGAAWVFMLKYNNVVPFAVAGFLVCCICIHRDFKGAFLPFSLRCLYGACAVAVPVLGYLWYTGALQEFWNIYITLNIETYRNMNVADTGMNKWITLLSRTVQYPTSIPLFAMFLVLVFFRFFPGEGKDTVPRYILLLVIASLYAANIAAYSTYYIAVCSPAGMLPAIVIARYLPGDISRKASWISFLLILFAAITINGTWRKKATMRLTQRVTPEFRKVEAHLATIPHARILYRSLDLGLGRQASTLPACRFWILLNGAPQTLLDEQEQAIRQRKADFCVVTDRDKAFIDLLQECGYEQVMDIAEECYFEGMICTAKPRHYILWQKK